MSTCKQGGKKTPAPTVKEPPPTGASRQLKLSRSAVEGIDGVHLDTCQKFLDSLEPVAMLLRKSTREIVACNKSAKDIGITVGSTCYQSWANRDTPCSWCQAPEVWKTGQTVRCQPEGIDRIWDAHWVPISEDLYLHYAQDITEGKRVEEALIASKTKLQGYIDNAPDGVLVVNGQGKILEANPAACKITGYPEEELIQLSIPQILAPESQEEGGRHFAKVVDEGSAHGEFVGLCKDGSKVHYSVDAVKVSEDRFMGFLKDITESKFAEEQTVEKQRQLDSLLSNVDAIILEGDPLDIYYVGGRVKDILGYSVDEWFEDPGGPVGFWAKHLYPDDADKVETCAAAIANGDSHSFEYRMFAADGRLVWFYDSVTVETKNGVPVKARSVMIDITARKDAEQSLMRQAHDLGERVEEMRGLCSLSQLTSNPDLSTEQVFQEASELLRPAWRYPEITCGRILVNGKDYVTSNYRDSDWKQSADIQVSGVVVGMIEVAYLEEMPGCGEGPFLPEERDLIDAMAQNLGQYIERHQNESRLRESNARSIEGQLALETKNIALSEVIEHVDREKKDTGFQIQSNIDRLVVPLLAKLDANANEAQKPYLSMLRSTLSEITSPFVTKLEKDSTSLTPREVEICNLIRSGLASKDIAQSLHTSEATVRTQRKTIRKKLGLSKSRTNLANYLQQV